VDEDTARRKIYIAAITRCYPGPHPGGRGDRVPSPAEQDACAVWLEQELRIIRPKLLIPVGKLAIARFLPNRPLDQLIGRSHDVAHAGGHSLAIPLPHPSGASSWIHQGDHPQLLDRALELIGRELQRLGIRTGPRKRSVA
jgi:uracil-DNA glycosylase